MIGSYYQAQRFDPIGVLGNVSAQASLAHEAIVQYLAGPIGRFAPWGEQTVNGWQEIMPPEYNYSIFPIGAQTLSRAEQSAFGNPVGIVGIMFREPRPLKYVDELFTEGPYEAFAGYVVFRLDDKKRLPTAEFLYLGKLADEGSHDGMGSYGKMERAVKAAGGVLVYALPEGRSGSERTVPPGAIESAVAASMGVDVPVGPEVPYNPAAIVPADAGMLDAQDQVRIDAMVEGGADREGLEELIRWAKSGAPDSSNASSATSVTPTSVTPASEEVPLIASEPVPTVPTASPAAGSSGTLALGVLGVLGGAALGYFGYRLVKRKAAP